MLNVKKMLTNLAGMYKTVDYQFGSISFNAGTSGTMATYQTKDVSLSGYTPIGAINTVLGHASGYHAHPTISGTTMTLYIYRATQTAGSYTAADEVVVTVLYRKN